MALPTPPRVLITHPGRQHSHQAALGLERAGMLAGYWPGVPCLAEHERWVPRRLWSRYGLVPLPPQRVRCAPWAPGLRRLGDRLPSPAARRLDYWVCRRFDRWAAARLAQAGASAVLACEISALDTFRRARQLGIVTLLDAPSFHHATQDRVQPILDSPALHRRIVATKDAELALADHVLTVSELARESYLAAGFPAARVHALGLGADLEIFRPRSSAEESRTDAPAVFVFAGATIERKGFDLLAQAFRVVATQAPATRLRVVGPRGEAAAAMAPLGDAVTWLGAVDQATLAAELRGADCLVLPSRHDSFGMVVAEALACGTPAIVSTMVGAKDLVEEGVTGWTVPVGDAAALADRLVAGACDPATLRGMREACRRRAERASWEDYHRRLATLLGDLLAAREASSQPEGSAA